MTRTLTDTYLKKLEDKIQAGATNNHLTVKGIIKNTIEDWERHWSEYESVIAKVKSEEESKNAAL